MDPASSRLFRRPYVAILVLLLALLLLVRFTFLRAAGASVVDSLVATSAQVTDALIGATVATLGVTFLIVVVFRSTDNVEEVTILPARRIGQFIQNETTETREWLVRVRTAAYFRARTLPLLAQSSRTSNRTITVRLVAMDPRDVDLSRRHLQTRTGSTAQWTDKRLRLEICATILTCVQQSKLQPRLDITVRLVHTLWVTSLDISSRQAIVAGPHYGHPAIAYSSGSEFYDTFRSEFETSFDGGEPVALESVQQTEFHDVGNIGTALRTLGLTQVATEPEDLETIRTMISDPERSNEYR